MKKSLSTHEAKTHLSRLIEDVIAGDEVIIRRGKLPVARIVKYRSSQAEDSRPKIGIVTSPPVTYSPEAMAALSDQESLESWGMK